MELAAPTTGLPYWIAEDRAGPLQVRFVGRGPFDSRAEALDSVVGSELELAWCKQVHGDRLVEARAGECGEADGLITQRAGIALSIATADCVPVVLGGGGRLAAVHAGWRGIAADIVGKAVAAMRGEPLSVWLGPAIGPCCYEVDEDVARSVIEATGPEAIAARVGVKFHLNLQRAVILQLRQAGVTSVARVLDACTRCHASGLWSYRRQGSGAGRNYTFAWLTR